jgi:hypothetical protein
MSPALREPLIAAGLAAIVAALLVRFVPPDGDTPAHLYRTLLVRDGVHIWDNLWFAGDYPLASYSALYYLPAALVGNVPFVVGAVVATAALFASLAVREWGEAAHWPVRVFGVLAAGPVVTGTYAYALGLTSLIAALRALQGGRVWLVLICATLTLGFSPLAFVFLCLVLFAIACARRRLEAKTLFVVAGVAALAAVEVAALIAFPENSVYPGSTWDVVGLVAVAVAGAALAREAPRGQAILAFFALWALLSVVGYFVPSPLGDNITRLRYVVFPLLLLVAFLTRFRPRWLAITALGVGLAYNVLPYVMTIPLRTDTRPAKLVFWAPAIDFLRGHLGPGFRVEVVPTSEHWDAYWIARAGIPIARGWYRQLDYADNHVLYTPLSPDAYRGWLRSLGVRFVLLPRTTLDPLGAAHEVALLRGDRSGLTPVFRTRNATIYELPHPTPMLTGPGPARVTGFGHERILGSVRRPGNYVLRVRYTPYWEVRAGNVCVAPLASGMTRLDVRAPGRFGLVLPEEADAAFTSLVGAEGENCPARRR